MNVPFWPFQWYDRLPGKKKTPENPGVSRGKVATRPSSLPRFHVFGSWGPLKFHQTGGYKEAIKVVLPIFFGGVGKIWGRSMPTFKVVF